MNLKKRNRFNKYKKERNILRNNIPEEFAKHVYVGSFQAHCILSRYYKAFNEYKKQKHV